MSSKIGLTLMILGVAVLAPIAHDFVSEYLAADTCLDQGGSFNYSELECDSSMSHPYVPYMERHSFAALLLPFAGLLIMAGVATLWFRGRGVA